MKIIQLLNWKLESIERELENIKEQGFDATIKAVNESNLIAAEGLEKLIEYEKTGLTPEQIYEIDKLYTEKCRELAELKKKEGCNV